MKIVQVAPWEETVPPKKYGGTELVVSNITEELVKRGHEVYLIAAGNSKTKAHLIPSFPKTLREEYPTNKYTEKQIEGFRSYWKFAKLSEIISTINELKPDIVHNHLNWRFILFGQFVDAPYVSTVHGSIDTLNEQETYKRHPNVNYISISNNQRKGMPQLNWIETVYNGIDVHNFGLGDGSGGYFVFLGRTTPEKGLAEICKMIKGTKHKLKIAAKIDAVDLKYYETEVKPYVDGNQIEYVGEVDHAGKRALLEKAAGLLMWLNWEEPFGLVVPEANACGTPVIINPRGSMKELIREGVNGYLVNTLDEMKKRLDDVSKLDRKKVREDAVQRFSVEKMVDDYLAVYEKYKKV
jgi:glycosyltransferase involved in cell wall biosynthesis